MNQRVWRFVKQIYWQTYTISKGQSLIIWKIQKTNFLFSLELETKLVTVSIQIKKILCRINNNNFCTFYEVFFSVLWEWFCNFIPMKISTDSDSKILGQITASLRSPTKKEKIQSKSFEICATAHSIL